MALFKFWILTFGLLATSHTYKTYDGYQILRVKAGSSPDVIASLETTDVVEILSEKRGLDKVDILVAPDKLHDCVSTLQYHNINFAVLHSDVGALVREERLGMLAAAPLQAGNFTYDAYHSLSEMHAHLDHLEDQFPNKVKVVDIGESYENRKIKMIHISNDIAAVSTDDKPIIWLDGGIHAREWVSPATVMYIVDALLQLHETNHATKINALLGKYQFMIAPQINPDGYEYSRSHDRLWRKTRKPSGCEHNIENMWGGCFFKKCYGVDPNRNWDADWGRVGVSDNPCSLVFPGDKPFDQKNTNAVKSHLEKQDKSKLKLYVTYHSYSQLFLTPLGYKPDKPDNWQHHEAVGKAVVAAIKGRHGAVYVNKISSGLYPASGDSADWVHDKLGLTDCYTVELRDTGEHGFELPTDQIQATGEENVDGLLALIDSI